MSATMARIYQCTISDEALINWIVLYNAHNGISSGFLASWEHTNVAFNLFESRAERIVMTKFNKGFVHNPNPKIPDRRVS